MFLCLWLRSACVLAPPVSGRSNRRHAWLVRLGCHGSTRRRRRAEAPAEARASHLAQWWCQPTRDLGPEAGNRHRRPLPGNSDQRSGPAHQRVAALHGSADAPPGSASRSQYQGRRSRPGQCPHAHRPPARPCHAVSSTGFGHGQVVGHARQSVAGLYQYHPGWRWQHRQKRRRLPGPALCFGPPGRWPGARQFGPTCRTQRSCR